MERIGPMKKVFSLSAVILMIGVLLIGCGQNTTIPEEVASAEPTNTAALPEALPSATPSPTTVILWAGAESDMADLAEGQAALSRVAQESGYVYEQRENLSVESAPENLALVLALPPASGVEQLAAALPQTKFVILGVSGLSSSGNLVVIGSSAPASDFQAFMAGYISAVQADDWRVGLIYVGDSSGLQYKNAFLTGVVYYCGTCIPYFPPYSGYPVSVEVAPGSGVEVFQQAVDNMSALGVNTLHLAPGAQSDEIYQYAAALNMRFVGTVAPPAGLEAYWIASVLSSGQVDLHLAIQQVLAGQTQIDVQNSIEITYTGLSEARLAIFQEMLEQLENGAVDPQATEIE